jgi:hypothetical protein
LKSLISEQKENEIKRDIPIWQHLPEAKPPSSDTIRDGTLFMAMTFMAMTAAAAPCRSADPLQNDRTIPLQPGIPETADPHRRRRLSRFDRNGKNGNTPDSSDANPTAVRQPIRMAANESRRNIGGPISPRRERI